MDHVADRDSIAFTETDGREDVGLFLLEQRLRRSTVPLQLLIPQHGLKLFLACICYPHYPKGQ